MHQEVTDAASDSLYLSVAVLFYQDFACCAAIPGNGTNKEFALHLLHLCNGDVKVTLSTLYTQSQVNSVWQKLVLSRI